MPYRSRIILQVISQGRNRALRRTAVRVTTGGFSGILDGANRLSRRIATAAISSFPSCLEIFFSHALKRPRIHVTE